MRWISSLADLVHRVLCLYTLLVYALCYWVFSSHWVAGFVMMSLPLALLLHFLIVVGGALIGARKNAFISLVMLVIAYPFWSRTYVFGKNNDENAADFRLLNYNVHQLGFQVRNEGESSLLSHEGLQWIRDVDAEILCMQEFYQEIKKGVDLVGALENIGYKHYLVVDHQPNQKPKNKRGLAIFSKYRIFNAHQEVFDGQNGLLKGDIRIGNDTITIINVHLQSMTLNLRDLLEQRKVNGIKTESQKTFARIKYGFEQRDVQIRILEDLVKQAKYPVIVCGDFNEVPYSYSYGRLSKLLKNSFESGGKGFGFSYNRLPYFIRIDNQFYDSNKIKLNNFETIRTVNFSDHFPLMGDYSLIQKPID